MSTRGASLFLTLFGSVFLAVGCVMGVISWRALQKADRMRSWVETPADVLSCNLNRHRGSKGGYTYSVEATYQYKVAGETHTGSRVSLYSGSDNIGRFHQRVYEELQRKMRRKQPAVCWVNPGDPADAILIRRLRPEMMIFFQLFVVAFGGAGLSVVLTGLGGVFRRRAQDPAEGRGRIRMNGASAHRLAGVLAVVWNAYLIFWAKAVIRVMAPEAMPWYLWLFALTGLIPAGVAAYLVGRVRKFGISVFEMSPMPGVLGGPVCGTIRIPAAVEASEGVVLKLQCVHQYTTGSGKHRTTHRDTLWEASQTIDPRGYLYGTETMLPVRFTVPSDKPGTSSEGGSAGYYWRLTATAAAPGIDYRAVFDVPVKRTPQSPSAELARQPQAEPAFSREPVTEALAREGLGLTPKSDGGFELVFPAGRPRSAVVFMCVFLGFWSLACAVLWITKGPVLFAALFTVCDVLLAVMFARQLLAERGVVADRVKGELTVWERLPWAARKERAIPFGAITDIRSESAGQTGNAISYRVVLAVSGGLPVTVGSGMNMWNDAENVAELLRASVKPGFVLDGFRV